MKGNRIKGLNKLIWGAASNFVQILREKHREFIAKFNDETELTILRREAKVTTNPPELRHNPMKDYRFKIYPLGNKVLIDHFTQAEDPRKDVAPNLSILLEEKGKKIIVWGARSFSYTRKPGNVPEIRAGIKNSARPSFVKEFRKPGAVIYHLEVNHPRHRKTDSDFNQFLLVLEGVKISIKPSDAEVHIWYSDTVLVHSGQEQHLLMSSSLPEPVAHYREDLVRVKAEPESDQTIPFPDQNPHPTVM